jgi:ribosome-associated protein
MALDEKKAENIVLLDIHEVVQFTDFFIICSGSSNRMLQALADVVAENAKPLLGYHGRIEGDPDYGWVLVDLGDIIVHIFTDEQREYYNLEELWSTGKVIVRMQ